MKILELKGKTTGELSTLLNDTQKELRDARKGLAAQELANPRVIREFRKTIAQIMTVMHEAAANESTIQPKVEKEA